MGPQLSKVANDFGQFYSKKRFAGTFYVERACIYHKSLYQQKHAFVFKILKSYPNINIFMEAESFDLVQPLAHRTLLSSPLGSPWVIKYGSRRAIVALIAAPVFPTLQMYVEPHSLDDMSLCTR